jgi:signal transduction histidine kinase
VSTSDLVPIGHGLAGLSHDLKNVLAILGESVGLLGDLIETGSVSTPGAAAERALERIGRQLERADALASGLSRFAHTFDDPDAAQPLSHLVDQVLFLVDRRARSRSVAVSVSLPDDPVVSGSIEFLLRLATLVASSVATLPAGSRLSVSGEGGRIIVRGERECDAPGSGSTEVLPVDDDTSPAVDFSEGGSACLRIP